MLEYSLYACQVTNPSQTILAVFAFFLLEVKSYLLSKISLVLTPKTTAKFVFFLRKNEKKKIFFQDSLSTWQLVSSYVVSHLTREVTHIVRLSLTRKHERQLGGLYSHRFTYLSFSTTGEFHLAGIFKFFLAVSKEWQILGFFFLVTVLTKQFQLENHRRKQNSSA